MDDMDIDESPQASLSKEILSINVLSLTNEARNMHGLRHQDYQRYRQFCAKKVQRLRKTSGIVQAGSKKRFDKKEITPDLIKGERELQILLFDAERGWAYAMELKQEIRDEPRKKFHMIKRLKRAVGAASKLLQVCSACSTDSRSTLQVEAYASLLSGYLLFEQQHWSQALEKFALSRTIYLKLADASSAQQAALCQSVVDTIDPNIRFCAYNLKIAGAQKLDIAALLEARDKDVGLRLKETEARVRRLIQSEPTAQSLETTISWRGKTIAVKNTVLRDAVGRAIQASEEIGEPYIPVPDAAGLPQLDEQLEASRRVLTIWTDAFKIADADVKEDERAIAKVKSSKSDENTANLQLALAYVAFQRLWRIIENSLITIQVAKRQPMEDGHSTARKLRKRENTVANYDEILKSIDKVKEIRVIETDMALQAFLAANSFLYKAQRAIHIAETCDVSEGEEALMLFERASEHMTHARAQTETAYRHSTHPDDGSLDLDGLRAQLSIVDAAIRRGKVREQAKRYLRQHQSGMTMEGIAEGVSDMGLEDKEKVEERPLRSRMDTFVRSFNPKSPNLIAFPPEPQPMPAKPLFFDIAYNAIEFPLSNISRRAAGLERKGRGEADNEGKGKGLLGVLGGFWGRK